MPALHEFIAKDGFRLRGIEVTRLDSFSDVVFGFALTLIVVSLEVPHTYDQLHKLLLGFIPFGICFMFLIWTWWAHYSFYRRFGLQDNVTIALNAMLLFTVLFYVYPLKFLFTLFVGQLTGQVGPAVFSNETQSRELMVVYGAGFAATYLILAAMYWNAWRQRLHLRLNDLEETLARSYVWNDVGLGSIGLLCIATAFMLPLRYAGYAGYCFWLVGPWKFTHGYVAGRFIRAAHARTTSEDRTATLRPRLKQRRTQRTRR